MQVQKFHSLSMRLLALTAAWVSFVVGVVAVSYTHLTLPTICSV